MSRTKPDSGQHFPGGAKWPAAELSPPGYGLHVASWFKAPSWHSPRNCELKQTLSPLTWFCESKSIRATGKDPRTVICRASLTSEWFADIHFVRAHLKSSGRMSPAAGKPPGSEQLTSWVNGIKELEQQCCCELAEFHLRVTGLHDLRVMPWGDMHRTYMHTYDTCLEQAEVRRAYCPKRCSCQKEWVCVWDCVHVY